MGDRGDPALAFWAATSPSKSWVLFAGGSAVARREPPAEAAAAAAAHLARGVARGALRVAWAVRGGVVVASFPSVPGAYVRARAPGDAAAAVAALVADAAAGVVAGVVGPTS